MKFFSPCLLLSILFSLHTALGQTTYYSKPGAIHFDVLSSWATDSSGTGNSPTAFYDFDTFVVTNTVTMSTSVSFGSITVGSIRMVSGTLNMAKFLICKGDIIVSGGSITFSNSLEVYGNVLRTGGVLSINGDLTFMGNTILDAGATITPGDVRAIGQALVKSNMTIAAGKKLWVQGILTLGNNAVVSGPGNFELNYGGRLGIQMIPVASFAGAVTVTGTRTYGVPTGQVAYISYEAIGNQTIDLSSHPVSLGVMIAGTGVKTLTGNTPVFTVSSASATPTKTNAILYVAPGAVLDDGGYNFNLNAANSHVWVDGGYTSSIAAGGLVFGSLTTSSSLVAVDGTTFGNITGLLTSSGSRSLKLESAGGPNSIVNISCRDLISGNSSTTYLRLVLSNSGTTNLTVNGNIIVNNTNTTIYSTVIDGTVDKQSLVKLKGDIICHSKYGVQVFLGETGDNVLEMMGTGAQKITVDTSVYLKIQKLRINKPSGTFTLGDAAIRTFEFVGALELKNGSFSLGSGSFFSYNLLSSLIYSGLTTQTPGVEWDSLVPKLVCMNPGGILLSSGARRILYSIKDSIGSITVDGASTKLFLGDPLASTSLGFDFTSYVFKVFNTTNGGTIVKNFPSFGSRPYYFRYLSTSTSQQIGVEMPPAISALWINNTSAGNIVSADTSIVTPYLYLLSGKLALPAGRSVTVNRDGIVGGGPSSYVQGALSYSVQYNSLGDLFFPIGRSQYNGVKLTNLSYTITSGTVLMEAIDAPTGGTAGLGMAALNTNHYWKLITGCFNKMQIQLEESGLQPQWRIAQSINLTGAYQNIGGIFMGGDKIMSGKNPVTYNSSYFVIGTPAVLAGGIYAVGPSGNYAKLKDVADALNKLQLTGDVIFELQTNYDGTTGEVFPIQFYETSMLGGNWNITIRPGAGVSTRTISSSTTYTGPLIELIGTKRLSIDGRAGGTSTGKGIAISNLYTNGGVAGAISITGSASYNTLRNLTLSGYCASQSGAVVYIGDAGLGSGNDSNSIVSCTIEGNGKSAFGIYAKGSEPPFENNANIIAGNNLSNIYYQDANSSAIEIASGNSGWTIGEQGNGNRIYFTSAWPASSNYNYYGIRITSGEGYNINYNVIGYANAAATGTMNISQVGVFYGIYAAVNLDSITSVQGNIISNISLNNLASNFKGISISGYCDVGSLAGNKVSTIGWGSPSSIVQGVSGIAVSCTSVPAKNIRIMNTSIPAMDNLSPLFCGISTGGNANFLIQENTIGGTLSGRIKTVATSERITLIGIANSSSGETVIQQNIISKMELNSSNTASFLGGILVNGGSNTITDNTVCGMYTSAPNISSTGSAGGILVDVGTKGAQVVSFNKIYSIRSTATTGTLRNIGICLNGYTTNNIVERNFIHSLSAGSTGASVIGISALKGSVEYKNNMIALGILNTGLPMTIPCTIMGIEEVSGTNRFYHNTVYVGGTGVTSTTPGNTYAFRSTLKDSTRIYRNNIFFNTRSNATTGGKHYAVAVSGSGLNPNGLIMSHNLLRSSGLNGSMLAVYNLADQPTFYALQTTVGQNSYSVNDDPALILPDGSDSICDLHIDPAMPTVVESAGILTPVTMDADSSLRDLSYPDIGADEGSFIISDKTFPTISYTPLITGSTSPTRTVVGVTINDGSGINTSALTKPRIYYKKNTEANTYAGNTSANNGWKYTEALNTSSPFQFEINYALLNSPLALGDWIEYFIVAQDLAPITNVGSNNVVFSTSPVGVALTAANFPVLYAPSYTVLNPISGNFTVGTGGDYATLTAALTDYNQKVAMGPVTFRLIQSSYSNFTGEVFPLTISENPGASPVNRLLIKPASGMDVVINSGMTTSSIIMLMNAKYVTIDGSNGNNNSFNLRLTSPGSNIAIRFDGVSGTRGCVGDTIKNTVVFGNGTSAFSSGILFYNTGDSCVVMNDSIYNVRTCITRDYNNAMNKLSNLHVIGNVLCSDTIIAQVPARIVQTTGFKFSGNICNGINGEQLYLDGVFFSEITGNIFTGKNTVPVNSTLSSNPGNVNGLYLVGCNNVLIANNTMSKLTSVGYSASGVDTMPFSLSAIQVRDCSNIKIYHNSVNMGDSKNSASSPGNASACLYLSNTYNNNIDIRNNVFQNTLSSILKSFNYAIVADDTSYLNANIFDYNNYYVAAPGSPMVQCNIGLISRKNYKNVSDIKGVLGSNTNSTGIQAPFVSATDLHLIGTTAVNTQLKAVPLSGILTDLEGNIRSTVSPFKGAYEITAPLPLKLLQFKGNLNGQSAELTWRTASEKQVNCFWIERSTNENQWEKIGKVAARNRSSGMSDYRYADMEAGQLLLRFENLYYRLVMEDNDGAVEYSPVVVLHKIEPTENDNIIVSPNPFRKNISLHFTLITPTDVYLEIYDITGKSVYHRQFKDLQNQSRLMLDLPDNLMPGFYTVHLTGEQINKKIKLIKE